LPGWPSRGPRRAVYGMPSILAYVRSSNWAGNPWPVGRRHSGDLLPPWGIVGQQERTCYTTPFSARFCL
jgi:hypothetical protein